MATPITADTVQSYIDSALTHVGSGNYTEARRAVTQAQIAKQALHKSEGADGNQHTWDTKITEILNSINALEAAENKSSRNPGLIRTSVGRA